MKKAQQRYETVPVLDPETGQPKKTPVLKTVKDWETGETRQVPNFIRECGIRVRIKR